MLYKADYQQQSMKRINKNSFVRSNTAFAEKIRKRKSVILFELLPPPQYLPDVDIDTSLSLFAKILKNYPIDAVNIPEVREETRSGSRNNPELVKLEPRIVGTYLQKYGVTNLIVNRPIVYLPWQDQKSWLQETYQVYNVHNFIFVGGESSKTVYPGLPVTEAAKTIIHDFYSQFPEILLGGITIPRRNNESFRVLQKVKSGIEFFTTQILYESESIKLFLQEYWELCSIKNIEPKTIILSFAPVATKQDIALLQWLGVIIPKETIDLLATGWLGMGWRSLQICQDILEEILQFVEKEHIDIPLGLNVEHVSRHNFETSFTLLEQLEEVYFDRQTETHPAQVKLEHPSAGGGNKSFINNETMKNL